MTMTLELKPETMRWIEEKAQKLGVAPEIAVEQVLEEAVDSSREDDRAELLRMADELFEERASAYEALAKGPQP